MNKLVLVAMAHADDMACYAGGTVAKLIAQGYRGVLVALTTNASGADPDQPGGLARRTPQTLMPIRHDELHASASEVGIDALVELGFKDAAYFDGDRPVTLGDEGYDLHAAWGREPLPVAAGNPACIDRVRRVIEKYEPEIVITHNLASGFERACGAHLVSQAFSEALNRGAGLGSLWAPAHVQPGGVEPDARHTACPNLIINVTDHWATKLRAIRAHKSQPVEGRIKKLDVIARYWGIARQCLYAEPFCVFQDARYR